MLGYRYHFQRASNELVFRYEIRHTSLTCRVSRTTSILANTVVAASKPDLLEVLQEAKNNS